MGPPFFSRAIPTYGVLPYSMIWVVIHARKVLDCVWGGIYRWVVKIKGALLISAYVYGMKTKFSSLRQVHVRIWAVGDLGDTTLITKA